MLIITAPGQGAQTPGFLAPWLELPGVAERLGTASELAGCDLIGFGTTASADEIKDTAVAQPLLVAAAIAAASALSDGDPRDAPADAAAGHRVGEQGHGRVRHCDPGGRLAQRRHGRRHVPGVEGPRDLQRAQPRPGRRIGREGFQIRQGPGGHDLPGPVHVRRGQPAPRDRRERRVLVTAEHRRHPGRFGRRGRRHRPSAHSDQAHRVVRGEHAGDDPGGQLSHAVPGGRVGGYGGRAGGYGARAGGHGARVAIG